jgi:hypothetical protein
MTNLHQKRVDYSIPPALKFVTCYVAHKRLSMELFCSQDKQQKFFKTIKILTFA